MDVNDVSTSTFRVDYAASARSKCNRCHKPIDQNELRIGPMVQSDKGDFKYPQWHHFSCFEDGWLKKNPGALTSVDAVGGVDRLQFADQKKVKSLVIGGDSTLETKALTDEEKRLAAESKLVFARQEKLDALSNNELSAILAHNDQPNSGKIFGGRQKMIERIADGMVFGRLPKCPVCKNGDFYFSHGEYKCVGSMNEFAKCENKTKDVARTPWSFPKGVAEDHDFLAKFKFKAGRERATETVQAVNPNAQANNPVAQRKRAREEGGEETSDSVTATPASAADSTSMADPSASSSSLVAAPPPAGTTGGAVLLPFHGAVVAFVGKLSRTQKVLEGIIESNGGKVAKSISGATVAVCTPQEATGGGTKKGQDALAAGILCVSEKWVDDTVSAQRRLTDDELPPYVLANPKTKDAERETRKVLGDKLEVEREAQAQRALLEEKYNPTTTGKSAQIKKVVVKGSGAVEADSGLVEVGHVYEPRTGEVFSSVMNLADVVTGKNSFYILQIIEHDSKNKWSVFRKWGKIGDEAIGGTKLTDFPLASAAERDFKKVFLDKTGNHWEQRAAFKKVYGKFMPIEIDVSGSETPEGGAVASLETAGYQGPLPKATQDFVSLIFDIKTMNDALKELEIDTQKMPLGKLSKNTIKQGYQALNELQVLLEKRSADAVMDPLTRSTIVSLSNQFYSFIPHAAPPGSSLPLLDTVELVRQKTTLLSSLQDLEVASKMISSSTAAAEGEHPIDVHYRKLNSEMKWIDRSSEEFKRINDYVQNTHGSTHTTYNLELVDLWSVSRAGEAERFEPFSHDKNRMLLWHGSRLANWGGIISQGLRIAPPEAPTTGYMFGKGVYFADMSSKSANYCFTTSEKTTGILMLCEVALGDMMELKHAKFVDGLPKPFLSTKGVGKNHPNPAQTYVEPNGCQVPLGKGCSSGVADTTLLYNEFIVYNVAQIRTRYVMRLNFVYHKKAGTFF